MRGKFATCAGATNMETSAMNSKSTDTTTAVPSDMVITSCVQQGLQDVALYTSIGLVVGGLMGIVLARGGNSSSNAARKVYTALGGGIGFGTAWTQTSIQLEQMLSTSTTTASAAAKK